MQALKGFAVSLLVMLKDFVTSKKVLAAVLTAVAGALVKDPTVRSNVVDLGMVLIGGIALVDHGKAKATLGPTFSEHVAAVEAAVKQALAEQLRTFLAAKDTTPPAGPVMVAAIRQMLAQSVPAILEGVQTEITSVPPAVPIAPFIPQPPAPAAALPPPTGSAT